MFRKLYKTGHDKLFFAETGHIIAICPEKYKKLDMICS
jgi:hypothetical protein